MDTMAENAAKIQSFFLDGPAGKLEALLNAGSDGASHTALVTHPHPLFGGTMHNKVVYHAAKALNSFGFPVLRFNFRGTGLSEGEHDQGRGEVDDVRSGLEWLRATFNKPIIFAGFSFGAANGSKAACPDPNVELLISLGTPVAAEGRAYTYPFLADCPKPKLFVSGDRDQYAPIVELKRLVQNAAEPKKLIVVPNADHFFEGQLPIMREAIESWISEQLGARSSE
jgi:alpha/beta superfamily hydrolase